jgi:hypothetical protein
MKKNINLILLFFVVFFVGACQDDYPEKSQITSFKQFGLEGLPTEITVNEIDTTLTFNFGLNQDQIMDVDVELVPTSASTATEGSDYDLSTHTVTCAAYSGGGSFSVDIYSDLLAESDEKIVLSIKGASPVNLPTEHLLTINIKNKVLPVTMTLDWQGNFVYAGNTYTLCANSDIDLYVINSAGNDATGYSGATGDCPELFTAAEMDALADGSYTLLADFWSNGLNGAGLGNVQIPMRLRVFKPGSNDILLIDTSEGGYPVWNGDSEGTENGGGVDPIYLGELRVSGSSFTLVNANDETIGTISN